MILYPFRFIVEVPLIDCLSASSSSIQRLLLKRHASSCCNSITLSLSLSPADGYTTEDLVFYWKEGDPVQIVKPLHLPRFTLLRSETSYCTSRTNTGKAGRAMSRSPSCCCSCSACDSGSQAGYSFLATPSKVYELTRCVQG